MITKKVKITNKLGFHARPANNFVKMAQTFKSKIEIVKDTKRTDAKSILGLLGLGVQSGAEIELVADGEDEQDAVNKLIAFIESGLGE